MQTLENINDNIVIVDNRWNVYISTVKEYEQFEKDDPSAAEDATEFKISIVAAYTKHGIDFTNPEHMEHLFVQGDAISDDAYNYIMEIEDYTVVGDVANLEMVHFAAAQPHFQYDNLGERIATN